MVLNMSSRHLRSILEARAHLDTSFHGPFGRRGRRPTSGPVRLCPTSRFVRFRCSLKRGALGIGGQGLGSIAPRLRSARRRARPRGRHRREHRRRRFQVKRRGGGTVTRVEAFSRALSTTLRAMGEQAAIADCGRILRGDLPTGGRSKRRGGGGAPPHQRCLPRRRSQPMQGLVRGSNRVRAGGRAAAGAGE